MPEPREPERAAGSPEREPTRLEEDLVALAAGRLPPAAATRMTGVLRVDAASRERFAAIQAHWALYEALPPAPPAPPLASVLAARDAARDATRDAGRDSAPGAAAVAARGAGSADRVAVERATTPLRRRSRRGMAVAIAAAVVAAAGAIAWWPTSPPASPERPHLVLASADAAAFRVTRGARAVAFDSADAGDVVTAARDGVLTFRESGADAADRGTEMRLREGARLGLLAKGQVSLQDGFAAFRVEHRPERRFVVTTPAVIVEDLGTTFSLDVSRSASGGPPRLLVTVEEGSVRANGTVVPAGRGLAFDGATRLGDAWPLDAKPVLSLERDAAGGPTAVRLVLSNPTDGWITVASPSDPHSPVFVGVTGPDGVDSLVRVTPEVLAASDRVAGEARLAGGIAPRGRVELAVRLDRTLTRRGTYRLRAVWQPAGSRERPTSPELLVTVP